MEEKQNIKNINFFKKIWYSITKFEKYPEMAAEGIASAIKYLILLTMIVTIFAMIGSLIQTNKVVENLAQYIEQNIPEFSFKDGKATMEIAEPIFIDSVEYSGIDRIIINPLVETSEQKEEFENAETKEGISVFFFNDEIILKSKISEEEVTRNKYTYTDFIESYTGERIENFNKAEVVEYLTSQKMLPFYARYGVSLFVYLMIINVVFALLDTLEIALLGWITSSLARIKMKFSAVYNMAVYSLTLSMFLNIIYIVINYFTKFTISYFQVAYITIAYIYLAATIFIIKDDIIKKLQEIEKIKQEQKKVREEIKEQESDEEKEPKNEDEPKEDKKEKDDEEPQGSEA